MWLIARKRYEAEKILGKLRRTESLIGSVRKRATI